MNIKCKILFDNNAFDSILSNVELFIKMGESYDYFTCSTAIEELAKIPDNNIEKRIRLLLTFARMEVKFIPDSIGIFDHSRYDYVIWSDENTLLIYNNLLNSNSSNFKDAIIATTAIKNCCTLLTNDKKLINKMKENNYPVISFEDFSKLDATNYGTTQSAHPVV